MTTDINGMAFRRAMSSFATGITVIACESPEGIRAMTASAVMSGSLNPPMIVICIGKSARLHEHLVHAGAFGVSFLSDEQQALSQHFAGQAQTDTLPAFEVQRGAPVLHDALTRVVAQTEHVYDCGDHSLFVGHVISAEQPGGRPLVHYSGRYCQLSFSA